MKPADFSVVRSLVSDVTGVQLDSAQQALVEARLRPLADVEAGGSVERLVGGLREASGLGLRRLAVEAVLNHETSFFRDAALFEVLRDRVLPGLAARRPSGFTIWCGACSSGQEPYSLAMLLADARIEARIVATDVSGRIVERARRGVYTQLEVNRGLPASMLVRHFENRGLDWALAEELRRRVEFRALNLLESWGGLPRPDLVLLRNVLIYFDEDLKRRVLRRTGAFLAPDGLLVLGAAESALPLDEEFERVDLGRTVAFRPRGGLRP